MSFLLSLLLGTGAGGEGSNETGGDKQQQVPTASSPPSQMLGSFVTSSNGAISTITNPASGSNATGTGKPKRESVDRRPSLPPPTTPLASPASPPDPITSNPKLNTNPQPSGNLYTSSPRNSADHEPGNEGEGRVQPIAIPSHQGAAAINIANPHQPSPASFGVPETPAEYFGFPSTLSSFFWHLVGYEDADADEDERGYESDDSRSEISGDSELNYPPRSSRRSSSFSTPNNSNIPPPNKVAPKRPPPVIFPAGAGRLPTNPNTDSYEEGILHSPYLASANPTDIAQSNPDMIKSLHIYSSPQLLLDPHHNHPDASAVLSSLPPLELKRKRSMAVLSASSEPVLLAKSGKGKSQSVYSPLSDIADSHVLLSMELAETLRTHLPPSLRDCRAWELTYSLDIDGASLNTLYGKLEDKGPCLILIFDGHTYSSTPPLQGSSESLEIPSSDSPKEKLPRECIFGAFASDGLSCHPGYHGTGHSWLFKQHPSGIMIYRTTLKNDYYVLSDKDCIGFGGGSTGFGLWVDKSLTFGHSGKCETFELDAPLSSTSEFTVVNMEIYTFLE